jgi:predicted TPR repeat methyltransferase
MTLIQPGVATEKETSVDQYGPLAPHYEAFVGGERYGEWINGLLALAAGHGVAAGSALDVGCGTGRSLAPMRDAGFRAAGCDPSPAMLHEARAALGDDVELFVAALPELPAGPRVDLVTAFNDVLNYVTPDELDAAVVALAGRLRRGGLLLFDANTESTYEQFFGQTFCRHAPGLLFVWESLPGEEAKPTTHRADLHAFAADPDDPTRWTRTVSRHAQHHHPHPRVLDALAAAGLELVALEGQRADGGRDDSFDEAAHSKRIYLARRP